MAKNPGYDKDGRFVGAEKGAYDHTGRKIGYDEDDMKNGISDVNTEYQDPRHVAREDEYLKGHPVLTGSTTGLHHFGPLGSKYLANTHGGHRTANDVRTDIRHGLNILKAKHPDGVPGGHHLFTAEDVGYQARQHHYIQREQDAAKKTAGVNTQPRSEQFTGQAAPTQTRSLWDDSGMDDAIKPAPKAAPKNEDTLGAAVKHVIGKLRKKS